MPFLPPNQQRQSTEGDNYIVKLEGNWALIRRHQYRCRYQRRRRRRCRRRTVYSWRSNFLNFIIGLNFMNIT